MACLWLQYRSKARYFGFCRRGVQIGGKRMRVLGSNIFIKIAACARYISKSSYQFNNAGVAARGKTPPLKTLV